MSNWPSPQSLTACSEHQREQAAIAFAGGSLALIDGAPGTGKTWTIKEIIKAIPGRRIAIGCPTGKAGARLNDSLAQDPDIDTGIRARTWHSLLGLKGDDCPPSFDESNPLPFDFLFSDESSMIDSWLMSHIMRARAPHCSFLAVGDPYQLAPVGSGAPFRDLIASGIPCGHLTEIQRNAGRIVQACKEIRETGKFRPSRAIDLTLESPENFGWIERSTVDLQIAELKTTLEKIRARGKVSVVWDCQVIVPLNDSGELARTKLNRMLQAMLNPMGEQAEGNPFRIGDKLVCRKNLSYAIVVNGKATANKVLVCNGEQGKVIHVETRKFVVQLWNPDRTVLVPRGKQADAEDGEDGGNSAGCKWELAYAISGHSSQGSEWPVVIIMVDGSRGAKWLCDRHWVYTAISRAKTLCLAIGQYRDALEMCGKSNMWDRKTFLRESIDDLRGKTFTEQWGRELMETMEATR